MLVSEQSKQKIYSINEFPFSLFRICDHPVCGYVVNKQCSALFCSD